MAYGVEHVLSEYISVISFSRPIKFHVFTRIAAHLPKLCRLKYKDVT
jgi:hypothetical protein